MRRFARWSRSFPVLLACNAALVSFVICVGWHAANTRHARAEVRLDQAARDTAGNIRRHVHHIVGGNLRVVATLLAGGCTLGVFTLVHLLWNAFTLGFGLSTLARGSPEAIPLALRYVPLEFSAFVLVASATEHLSFTVLRYLAASETPRFRPATIALAIALGMLVVAAIIEARVTQLVAAIGA